MFTGGRQEEGCVAIDRTETIGRTNKITSFLIRYLDHDTNLLIVKSRPFLDRDFVAC